MKIKTFTFAIVRLLSIYVMIRGLEHLTNMIQLLYPSVWENAENSFSAGLLVMLMVATGVILIVIGVGLWMGASRIAQWILGDKEAEVNSLSIRNNDLYTVGLILIGIVLLVNNIPGLLGYIGHLVQIAHMDVAEAFDRQRSQAWIELGVTILKLVLAGILIIRPGNLTKLILKLRKLGAGDNREQK